MTTANPYTETYHDVLVREAQRACSLTGLTPAVVLIDEPVSRVAFIRQDGTVRGWWTDGPRDGYDDYDTLPEYLAECLDSLLLDSTDESFQLQVRRIQDESVPAR